MQTMEISIARSRVTLLGALNDPEMLALLSRYGYDNERLQEGVAHCDAAYKALRIRQETQMGKKAATRLFQQRFRTARLQYSIDLRCARATLQKFPVSHRYLQLEGDRADAFEAWTVQAKNFYVGLQEHPEWQEVVVSMGLTNERVAEGIQRIQELEAMRAERNATVGDEKGSRQQGAEAFQALNDWMVDFRSVARIALATYPDHLLRMGLKPIARKNNKSNGTTPTATTPQHTLGIQPMLNNMGFALPVHS